MKNRVVLSANASFETEVERQFWNSLDALLARQDWVLVHCVARRVPPTRFLFRTPHRLSDAAWFFEHLELPEGIPAWLTAAEFALILDWERLRFPEVAESPAVEIGLRRFAWYVDQVFRLLDPAACLVSNKIDPAVRLYWLAAPHFGVRRIFCERSPFDGMWVEGEGMFGESEIPVAFASRDCGQDETYRRRGAEVVRGLRKNPEGFRPQNRERRATEAALRALHSPRVFLPFDNILWTGWAQPAHPQLQADYFVRDRPEVVIGAIAEAVAAAGGELFVKRHPCCRSVDETTLPGVRFLNDGHLDSCLRESDIVLGFNTKVIFPALALGKPCIVLSPNPVTASGLCLTGTTLAELPELLRAAAEFRWNDAREAEFEIFCGWLDEAFFYRVTPGREANRRTQYEFAARLLADLESTPLHAHAATAMPGIARLSELNRKESSAIVQTTTEPITLFLDISRLANRALWNSGISRCIRDLAAALVRRHADATVLLCERGRNVDAATDIPDAELVRLLGAVVLGTRDEVRAELERRRAAGTKCVYLSTFSSPAIKRISADFDARAVVLHDLFHLSEPDLYGGVYKESNVSRILGGLDPERDFVVTVSGYTRAELHRLTRFPHWRTTVIPNAANSLADLDGPPREGRYFVLFAQNDPRKNIDLTLEAVALALSRLPADEAARCVVVASEVYLEGSAARIAAHTGSDPRFEMLSSPDDAELAALLRGAQFLVFTPLLEGFGLPALEAIVLGCPVVASFTSSLPEVCGRAAIYVDPEDTDDIASKIELLLGSETALARLRAECPAQAAKFSWDLSADRLLAWLENRVAMAAGFAPQSAPGETSPASVSYGHYGVESVPDRRLAEAVEYAADLPEPSTPRRYPVGESVAEYARSAEAMAEDLRRARRELQRLRDGQWSLKSLENRARAVLTPIWRSWRARAIALFRSPE